MRRSFLLLQGAASPFFRRLSHALTVRGHIVRRVNFCGGDLAYSGPEAAWNYCDPASGLSAWYEDKLKGGGFTDITLFGDCRAIHLPVHEIAQRLGTRVHVFEEGYIRPHWLTLERHGVNGRSLLSRDPAWYMEHRAVTPESPAGRATGYNLYERAKHDICYRAANALYLARFPHYQSHRPHNGYIEYKALFKRFMRQRQHHREAIETSTRMLQTGRHYYLFPLQLNSDSQILVHSPFGGVHDAIERVLRSFAAHAPTGALLLIKNHPLDTGIIDFRHFSNSLARQLGIADRLAYIEGGHLPTLLDHARGVVVVNSTVGLSALHHRRPLIALGTAVYDMPGLTWQGGLDCFWRGAEEPDMALYQAFVNYILCHTQVNGDFYTRTGIEMAMEGVVQRLEAVANE